MLKIAHNWKKISTNVTKGGRGQGHRDQGMTNQGEGSKLSNLWMTPLYLRHKKVVCLGFDGFENLVR